MRRSSGVDRKPNVVFGDLEEASLLIHALCTRILERDLPALLGMLAEQSEREHIERMAELLEQQPGRRP